MNKGEFIKDIINSSFMPVEVKKREITGNASNSIFGDALVPKFEQIVDKGSKIFENFNSDLDIKRNERIRKEMETRDLCPTIEDEIIDTFISIGKDIIDGIGSLFGIKAKQ